MGTTFITVPSESLNKALRVDSTAQESVYPLQITGTEPTDDGVFEVGMDSGEAYSHLKVIPCAGGPIGSQFYLKLWSWTRCGVNNPNTMVWIPIPLAELFCTTGDIPGPTVAYGQNQARVMSDSERLAEELTVTRGSLGTGEIVMWGPGFAAFALVELRGAQKIQFEFAQLDKVSMNAWFARA